MNILRHKQAAWIAMLAISGTETLHGGPNVWTQLGQDTAISSLSLDPRNHATVYAATGAGLAYEASEDHYYPATNGGLGRFASVAERQRRSVHLRTQF